MKAFLFYKAFLAAISCMLLFFSFDLTLSAEEPDRGRLPDGRAFRTDSDGIQLVDYIAELEQSVTELNRKVISLEDENINVKADLERVKAGRPENVAEKDLLQANSDTTMQAAQIQCPKEAECVCPESNCPVVKNSDCDALLKPVNARVAELEAQIANQIKATENSQEIRARMNTDLEESRHKAIESIRSTILQDLRNILSRKDERDLLFKKHITEKQGVALQPSSLRARSGRDLKQLEDLIKKAETVRELSLLKVDLEEIRRQMADDLALVERMSKLQ